ncbi:MAG: TRAP transporter small permease, partial [Acidiferrobacteraceae bacterium]|nr:TRAP transporter small permease [Acidiferrobacteraceae bacterium]
MKAHPLRRALDGVYFTAGMLGAVFLLALLVIIVLQMAARWTGQVFPGSTNYAG